MKTDLFMCVAFLSSGHSRISKCVISNFYICISYTIKLHVKHIFHIHIVRQSNLIFCFEIARYSL